MLGRQDTAEKQAIAALVSNPYTEEALLVLSACQPDAKTLLDRVLPLYPSEAKGASFLADFAERRMLPALRTAAAAHLSAGERLERASVTELFAQAADGDLAGLMQGLPRLAGQAVQQLFAALVLLPEGRRRAQPERAAEWQAALPAPMRRLIGCLYVAEPLEDGDEGVFFTGLDALDGFASEAQLLPYARLAEAFGPAALLRTAQWLLERRMMASSFDLLQRIPAEFLADEQSAAEF